MATFRSNFDSDVRPAVVALRETWNLRRKPGGSAVSLGESLIDAVALTVEHRTINEQRQPDLAPLKPLSPRYLAAKVRAGYSSRIGVRKYRMLQIGEIKGETYVGKTIATMTFGLSRETRDEASWFTEGGKNRPARPFYELGPSEEKAIAAVIDDAAEQQRRALGF
jgi:hypothetical protein